MTPLDMDRALGAGMMVCAAMIVLNLLMVGKRGNSALVMASAFAVLGFGLYLWQNEAPVWQLAIVGVLLLVLLASDVALRSMKQAREAQAGKKR